MKKKACGRAAVSLLLALLLLASAVFPVFAVTMDPSLLEHDLYLTSKADYDVASGITESVITLNNADGTNQMTGNVLEVDLSDPSVRILASYQNYDASVWGMQKLRDQAYAAEAKLGVNVVAGVNGDFYNMTTGAPTGTFVMAGTTYVTNDHWNYFAILNDGTPIIGSGALDTANVRECVGGPAVLLKDGEMTEDAKTSAYGVDQLPRTAVGIKADGSVVLFVTDGRQAPNKCGQNFIQLAVTMRALGCVDALSLDGGGSSTFLSQRAGREELICRNKPSDGAERTVSSALLVCSSAQPLPAPAEPGGNTCEETGHSYVYSLNTLTCSVCGDKIPSAGYTGFAVHKLTSGKIYFINGNIVKGWVSVGNDNYYFGVNGTAQTGTLRLDGHTYTFGEDGKMIKGSLEKQSSGRYCYYINGELQRGWYFIDGYWYYFNRVSTNFMSVNTENATIEGLTYSFGSDSRLLKGAWNTTELGTSYYWGPNYVTGLQEIDGDTYYFKPSDSYKLVNDSVDIDGTVYAFDAEGKLAHYGGHVDADGDGSCDLCRASQSPLWNLLAKLIALIEKIKIFLTKIFG